jgi:hypothetical protein
LWIAKENLMRVAYVETLICVNSFERKWWWRWWWWGGVNYAIVRAVDCELNANGVTHLGHVRVSSAHSEVRATVCGLRRRTKNRAVNKRRGFKETQWIFTISRYTFSVRMYVRNVCFTRLFFP